MPAISVRRTASHFRARPRAESSRAPGRLLPVLLLILLAVVSGAPVSASADEAGRRSFHVPAGELEDALNTFARQAGITLSFDPALVRGKTAPALEGDYSVREGLQALLAGSGLEYAGDEDGGTLRRAVGAAEEPVLPSVTVTAREERPRGYVAYRDETGAKTDTPLIETPQSVSVVTRAQLDAQQVDSIKQALRYSAGVTPETRAAFGAYDIIYDRGFVVDRYLDGMRLQGDTGYVTPQAELYGIERVELLRGPASVLFGQGSPGGLVNMVSKRPPDQPLHELELQAGNFDRKEAALDLGGPLDADGKFSYRITGLVREADSQVDFVESQRLFIAPALTWRPTADTSLTLLANYQRDPKVGLYNFVPSVGSVLPNPNGKIPTSFYAGDPNFDRIDRTQQSMGYLFEHRFDDVWAVRQNVRYQNTTGHLDQVLPFGPEPDDRTLDRYSQATRDSVAAYTVDNQAEAKFSTGALRHTVLFGIDYQHTRFDENLVQDFAPSIDLFAPVYHQSIDQPSLLPSNAHQSQEQTGFYAQDQARLDRLIVVVGARYDQARSTTEDVLNGGVTSQKDEAATGRIGVVYLLDNGLAPFATYATSFQPTAGTDFSGRPFDPTTGALYEAGLRYQPPGSNSLLTVSAYQLTQQKVTTADTTAGHDGFLVQTGEIRSRGVELEEKLSLTNCLDLIGSYTYTDARVTKSNDADLDKVPLWIPRNAAALWADYSVHDGTLDGLSGGLGVRFIDDSFGDPANTLKIPSYTLADAALHYDFGGRDVDIAGYRLSLNVANLFDKEYVSECTGDNCLYGVRRSVIATLRYRW